MAAYVQKIIGGLLNNTTDANYRAWIKIFSDSLAACGWIQCNDTGQIVHTQTTMTITAVVAGTPAVYSYTGLSGPALRIGMSVVVIGCANGGNNGTFTITALGTGTFSVTNASAVNETPGAATASTTLTNRPGASTYAYEIWQPNDSLQTGSTQYFLRVDYGSGSTLANPQMFVTLGQGTNGAGTLTGFTIGGSSDVLLFNDVTAGIASDTLSSNPWYVAGDINRFSFAFVYGISQTILNIERTHQSDGTDSNEGITLFRTTANKSHLRTLLFNGIAPPVQTITANATGVPDSSMYFSNSLNYNNKLGASPIFPFNGQFMNPLIGVIACPTLDWPARVFASTTIYGATHKYLMRVHDMDIGFVTSDISHCMRFD